MSDKEVYEGVRNDPSNLERTIFNKVIFNKDPKFATLYLLPKIHQWLHSIPGGSVISNWGHHTENILSFLYSHLEPLAKKVESNIKHTSLFLKKFK